MYQKLPKHIILQHNPKIMSNQDLLYQDMLGWRLCLFGYDYKTDF